MSTSSRSPGLTAVPGKLVSAPRIGEAQVSFECRLTEIIQLSDMHGASSSSGWCAVRSSPSTSTGR